MATKPKPEVPKEDYKAAVIRAIETKNQAARALEWDAQQAYIKTLATNKSIVRDQDGVPVNASFMGHEEELGADFVKNYFGIMQGRYKWNDRLTSEHGDGLMNMFTGKTRDAWQAEWQRNGANMSAGVILKGLEAKQKAYQQEGQRAAQEVLVPMLTQRGTRHALLKTAGLEDKIGKEDEPVFGEQIVPAVLERIFGDQDLYKRTINAMYGIK